LKQFYETYKDNEKVATLLTQLSIPTLDSYNTICYTVL